MKYPAFTNTVQINDMYSYSQAGLPTTKRLQVNEPVAYRDQNNNPKGANLTANLDSAFTYNGLGVIASMSYPSTGYYSLGPTAGASYTYSFDNMNRLSGMTDASHNTIVSNVSYNAANQLLTMNYPGVNEVRGYNALGQLTGLNTGGENLTYNYPTGTNNGKVSSMYNAVSGETVTYTYDSLNRLLTANGSGWGQQYGFDSFGNLLSKTVTAGSGPSLSVSVNAANNQIQGVSGLSYDANGNQNVGTYDAENRLSTVINGSVSTSYFYDAQNRRIYSSTGARDVYNNPTNYTVNIYTPGGQKLGAYVIAPAFVNNPVQATMQVTLSSNSQYFGGRMLAAMDQLGSVGTYYPWGENKGGTNPQDTFSFATYWRDSATSLDYANNRYYYNAYGRFMTPDPATSSGNKETLRVGTVTAMLSETQPTPTTRPGWMSNSLAEAATAEQTATIAEAAELCCHPILDLAETQPDTVRLRTRAVRHFRVIQEPDLSAADRVAATRLKAQHRQTVPLGRYLSEAPAFPIWAFGMLLLCQARTGAVPADMARPSTPWTCFANSMTPAMQLRARPLGIMFSVLEGASCGLQSATAM